MTLQQQEQERKKKSTKKYDAVAKKVRKLLSASAQTFIPELCEALYQDWFSEYTHEQIKQVKEARDNIRDKVFEDWSYEHGGRYSEDNIWADATIRTWIPDWLINPIQQESQKEAMKIALAAQKIKRKSEISEREKQKLDAVATNLPDSVIPPKPKEPSYEGEELDLEGGRLASYGASGKTISQMKGDITNHAAKLFEALTEIDHMPHKDEDITVDYIKPTRQYRKSLVLELDDQSRKTVWNYLGSVEAVIQDMLDLLQEELKNE